MYLYIGNILYGFHIYNYKVEKEIYSAFCCQLVQVHTTIIAGDLGRQQPVVLAAYCGPMNSMHVTGRFKS